MIYRISVLAMIIFGSVAKIQIVWDLADLFMGFMVIINLIAITLLSKVAFAALQDYINQKKAGKDPILYKENIKGLENIECWDSYEKTSKRKVCNKKDIQTAICLNIFLGSSANIIDYSKEKIILYKVNSTGNMIK